jgi:hypothetical protein
VDICIFPFSVRGSKNIMLRGEEKNIVQLYR